MEWFITLLQILTEEPVVPAVTRGPSSSSCVRHPPIEKHGCTLRFRCSTRTLLSSSPWVNNPTRSPTGTFEGVSCNVMKFPRQ